MALYKSIIIVIIVIIASGYSSCVTL